METGMILPTIEKARHAFKNIQDREIEEWNRLRNIPPGITETFYLNALLREALGIEGDYEMERYDTDIN